uniref:Anaphase-promoting complex subunit 11 n=1 Tax=Setaria digitata TaxID=48799 RepID=A0A915PTU3_9BILA
MCALLLCAGACDIFFSSGYHHFVGHDHIRTVIMSPVAYVLETTSSSSSQLSEGADQNTLSSSSSSPSLAAALRNFDIGNSMAREHSRDVFGYSQDESSTQMESYMEYLALLNHRHAQEAMDESSAIGGSNADVTTNESLSLLTNTTNSLSFGLISSINDENGEHTVNDNNRLNEAENNNEVTGGSSVQVNDFGDVELALVQDLYSPSASDPGNNSERRESEQIVTPEMVFWLGKSKEIDLRYMIGVSLVTFPESGSFTNSVGETPRSRSEANPTERSYDSSRDPVYRAPSSSIRFCPQPLKLPSSTRLKITVLKWNVAASWKWTAGDETCGICRMPFEACCIECKTPGDECPLALGACKHAFHMHCIVKWTETQNTARPQCPLCRQEWKFAPG